MKNTLYRHPQFAGHRVRLLLLCTLLAAAPLGGAVSAAPAPSAAILDPVNGTGIGWLNKNETPIQVTGTTIRIDLTEHHSWNFDNSMQWSALSKSPLVTASIEGKILILNVLGAGRADIELRAEKAGAAPVVDSWVLEISKTGDINGDGQITSADALYIIKVVNSKLTLSPQEINRLDINRDGVVTLADSTALLSNYVGKTSTSNISYIVNLLDANDGPGIKNGRVEGELKVGALLTARYDYYDVEDDPEAGASYQWYRGKEADGSDKTAITGVTSGTYTITSDDLGYYLFAEVTPEAGVGVIQGLPNVLATASYIPDTTPPELAAAPAPAGLLTKVQSGEDWVLAFNEPVRAGSGKIVLRKNNDTLVGEYSASDAAHVSISDNTVTLLNHGLDELTEYTVTVEPGAIVDLAGNPFAGLTGEKVWRLTTPDLIGPRVNTKLPAAHAVQVLPSSNLVLTFNEPVRAVPGRFIVLHLADGSTADTIAADDTLRVSIQGAKVTIKPAVLEENEAYYVTVPEGAFTDAAGNFAEGVAGTTGWDFEVADITSPAITGWTPSNHAKQVLPGSALVLTYSEPVQAAAGKTITIYNETTHTETVSIPVDDTDKVTILGNQVTVANPGLLADMTYRIDLAAGAFTDASGNPSAALSGNADWSFAMIDTIAPQLVSTLPAKGGVSGGSGADLTMTFSEPVLAAAGKKIVIHRADDGSAAAELDAGDITHVAAAGTAVTLTGLQLEEKTDYYITVEEGALADLAGNHFAGFTQATDWRFTVPDKTAPTATDFSPARSSSAAGMNTPLVLTFSENVSAVSSKAIRIVPALTHAAIATYNAGDTASVQVAGNIVTIANPGLADGTAYHVEIDSGAFRDEAGNGFAGFSGSGGWSFSTPDTLAPLLTGKLPAASATGVGLSTDFMATFNEPVAAKSGKQVRIRNLDTGTVAAEFAADDSQAVTVSGQNVTIHNPGLLNLTTYGIEIEAGAFIDGSGNPFGGILAAGWSFSTPDPRGFNAQNMSSDFSAAQMMADNGAVLLLSISGDTFKGTLTGADFTLNHAPAGVTISSAAYAGGDSAYLTLGYDGTPFTGTVTDFSVTAATGALASGKPATSGTMTIVGNIGPKVTALAPQPGNTDADKRGVLSIAYDKTISSGVSGKKISIYKASDDSLVQQIDAADSAKVSISGNTVNITPNWLLDATAYYVLVDKGAFAGAEGGDSPAISGKADWRFTTSAAIPGPFFSEYLDAGDGRIATEIYSSVPNADYENYYLVLYKYMKSTGTVVTTSQKLINTWKNNMLNINIDTIFYDAMDIMNIWYYNDEFDAYNPNSFILNAMVITDPSGKVIDVLGDPAATGPSPFLPNGGTIVRKPSTYGGSPTFRLNQWTVYPKGTLQYFGTHTN